MGNHSTVSFGHGYSHRTVREMFGKGYSQCKVQIVTVRLSAQCNDVMRQYPLLAPSVRGPQMV